MTETDHSMGDHAGLSRRVAAVRFLPFLLLFLAIAAVGARFVDARYFVEQGPTQRLFEHPVELATKQYLAGGEFS